MKEKTTNKEMNQVLKEMIQGGSSTSDNDRRAPSLSRKKPLTEVPFTPGVTWLGVDGIMRSSSRQEVDRRTKQIMMDRTDILIT